MFLDICDSIHHVHSPADNHTLPLPYALHQAHCRLARLLRCNAPLPSYCLHHSVHKQNCLAETVSHMCYYGLSPWYLAPDQPKLFAERTGYLNFETAATCLFKALITRTFLHTTKTDHTLQRCLQLCCANSNKFVENKHNL